MVAKDGPLPGSSVSPVDAADGTEAKGGEQECLLRAVKKLKKAGADLRGVESEVDQTVRTLQKVKASTQLALSQVKGALKEAESVTELALLELEYSQEKAGRALKLALREGSFSLLSALPFADFSLSLSFPSRGEAKDLAARGEGKEKQERTGGFASSRALDEGRGTRRQLR